MIIDFWLRHGCRRVCRSQQGWHFMFAVTEKMRKAGMNLVKPLTCNLLFSFTYFSVSVFIDHLEWVITKNVRSNKTTLYSEQLKKKKKKSPFIRSERACCTKNGKILMNYIINRSSSSGPFTYFYVSVFIPNLKLVITHYVGSNSPNFCLENTKKMAKYPWARL